MCSNRSPHSTSARRHIACMVMLDSFGLDHVYCGRPGDRDSLARQTGTPGSDMPTLHASPTYDEAQPEVSSRRSPRRHGSRGHRHRGALSVARLNFCRFSHRGGNITRPAYNDWLRQYCAADPRRLYGGGGRPIGAVAVDRRCGLRGCGAPTTNSASGRVLAANPCLGEPSQPEPRAVRDGRELDVTIGIHEGSSNTIETLGADRKPFNRPSWSCTPCRRIRTDGASAQLITRASWNVPELAVRVPSKPAAVAPYWLWRLDEQVGGFGGLCQT